MRGAETAMETTAWIPTQDPDGYFSTGIPDFDRLLGGGFRRGSFALFNLDGRASPEDARTLLTPLWLNFLYQSRGLLMVLPARESPHRFREYLLGHVSRRLFDSRVRIVDYVGEGDSAPYVVPLVGSHQRGRLPRSTAIRRMVDAEKAVRGARTKPYLEFNALEVLETLMGAEVASRMYLFGIKRTREVGNLGIAVARPGLACVDGVRSMVDYEFDLRRSEQGLSLSGVRPAFPARLVVEDPGRGFPHLGFV